MLQGLFEQCAAELCSPQFNRNEFLKIAAEIAPIPQARCGILLLYGIYYSQHHKNYQKALQCLEKSLALKPHDISVSLLLAAKGAILSWMDKPNQSLLSFKEASLIASGSSFSSEQAHIRKIFPVIAAHILNSINTNRGRRQFLVFLDNVRVKTENVAGLEEIERMASMKVNDIRDHMRHNCREGDEEKDYINSRMKSSRREASPPASIYITRLYEERKMALSKRQHSGMKKTAVIDPYQWRKHQREQSAGECQYM